MRNSGYLIITAILLPGFCGCATGPITFFGDKECDTGIEPGSAEWWADRAHAPPGARQVCHKGKMWPVRPRPTGERQQFTHAYHSEHYWPLPYVCQDRSYVQNLVATQEGNGWREETTIYERHFDENEQLNVPGRLHLIDIMEVTPSRYRTVYVQSSYDADLDNIRVANVQQSINELTGGTEPISVLVRHGRDYSRPASEVKIINDLYNSSVPPPRLAGAAAGGGGGGGGAALGP